MRDLKNPLSHSVSLATGMILGAAAMYALDPDRGERRRALARDKAVRAVNDLGLLGSKRLRDLRNHVYGSAAEMRSKLRDRARAIPDNVLRERVRAQIGHVVSHPGALDVEVRNGRATVSGPVLGSEIQKLDERLAATRGLRGWKLMVEAHAGDDNIPGLQGKSRFQIKRERGEEVDESVA
jgi:hypothetical protein